MRNAIRLLALYVFAAAVCLCQVSVTVTGPVLTSGGQPYTGDITITSGSVVCGGAPVITKSLTLHVVSGTLKAKLLALGDCGQYYTATYQGNPTPHYWTIPSTPTTTTVGAIEALKVPSLAFVTGPAVQSAMAGLYQTPLTWQGSSVPTALESVVTPAAIGAIPTTAINQPNGVVGIGADGTVSVGNMPLAPAIPVPSQLFGAATITDAADKTPFWMSLDRKTIFAGYSTTLYSSVDDGATWTTIYSGLPGTILGVRQLDNGELLLSLYGTPGTLYLSAGYPQLGRSAVWSTVLTASGANQIQGQWGISTYGTIVVASEYGSKIAPTNARYVYLSTDSGATFTKIFDIGAVDGSHIHGVAYDPWWDAIWVVNGDNGYQSVRVSFDHGSTWTTITPAVGSTQYVGILPMPGCILFTTDGVPNGVHRVPRTADRSVSAPVVAYALDALTFKSVAGTMPFRASGDMPALLPFAAENGHGIILSTYDGYSFSVLWQDTATYILKGPQNLFGPTLLGHFTGMLLDDRQSNPSLLVLTAPPTRNSYAVERATAISDAIFSVLPGVASGYYLSTATQSVTATTRGNNTALVSPVYIPRTCILDRISLEVTSAGSAGSVIRLGIYGSDSNGLPGPLLVDAGTIDSTGTGFLEKTISLTVHPGVYWLAAVPQGSPTTAATIRVNMGAALGLGFTSGTTISTGVPGYAMGLVTGALPTPYVIGSTATNTARVLVRVK